MKGTIFVYEQMLLLEKVLLPALKYKRKLYNGKMNYIVAVNVKVSV